ncbi:MAG TPA: signal peptidase I [Candidatus Methylomirabilis sp.]|nr:signal peptidase I [Candidatus Methylomirabilis sp.]
MENRVMERAGVRRYLLRGSLAALLFFLLQAYAFRLVIVPSWSMAPTLRPGDVVLVDRLTYEFGSPKRGDMVEFHFRQADDRTFLKRVIGVPGDTIVERDGRLWVNGAPLAWPTGEAQIAAEAGQSVPPVRVPAGHYFVLGDNLASSLDSRFWGSVDLHEVVGKALLICWSDGARWWDVRWDRIGRWLR